MKYALPAPEDPAGWPQAKWKVEEDSGFEPASEVPLAPELIADD